VSAFSVPSKIPEISNRALTNQ